MAEIEEPYPRIVQSISLFYSNAEKNSDKEYHIQLINTAPLIYTVHSQYGKRGSKLIETVPHPPSNGFYAASRALENLAYEKRYKKGYKSISFDNLESIYRLFRQESMEKVGVDLFINIRGKIMSLADYAKKSGIASSEQYPVICSYAAARSIGEMMAQFGQVGDVPSDDDIKNVTWRSHALINSAGMERIGIFVGQNKDGDVVNLSQPSGFSNTPSIETASKKIRPR